MPSTLLANSAAKFLIDAASAIDNMWLFSEMLERAGYGAHLSYIEHDEKFCVDSLCRITHRMIALESAKERFTGEAIGMPGLSGVYVSEPLTTLRNLRDLENGMPKAQLRKHFSGAENLIRAEIDPCARARLAFERDDPEAYEAAWGRVKQKSQDRVKIEAKTLFNSNVEREQKILIRHAIENKLSKLGFNPQMRIRKGIDYCSRKNLRKDFFLLVRVATNGNAAEAWNCRAPALFPTVTFALSLDYIDNNIKVEPRIDSGTRLPLNFSWSVPSFRYAYERFYDFESLNLCVRAQLELLILFLERLEDKFIPTVLASKS